MWRWPARRLAEVSMPQVVDLAFEHTYPPTRNAMEPCRPVRIARALPLVHVMQLHRDPGDSPGSASQRGIATTDDAGIIEAVTIKHFAARCPRHAGRQGVLRTLDDSRKRSSRCNTVTYGRCDRGRGITVLAAVRTQMLTALKKAAPRDQRPAHRLHDVTSPAPSAISLSSHATCVHSSGSLRSSRLSSFSFCHSTSASRITYI